MKKSTRNLVVYGGLAAAAYYFFIRKPVPAPAPVAAAGTPAVAGFGYFPSGTDRPFARAYSGAPSAWWRTHNW